MIIDKQLCNKILEALTDDYPSTMSNASWNKAVAGETDIKRVAAHFKYLEEKSYIDTEVREEQDRSGDITFSVELGRTRIKAYGLDFISDGGFTFELF